MFKGSNVALITPFKDNILDEEAYIKLILPSLGSNCIEGAQSGNQQVGAITFTSEIFGILLYILEKGFPSSGITSLTII